MKENPCLPTDESGPYSNFAELLENEVEGRDFIRVFQVRNSPLAIVAPHGGGIEPGTSEIARAIAGSEYSLYCFESLKADGNDIMHIPSHVFDDPLCTRLMQTAKVVVSIHGCGCEEDTTGVFVGGRHEVLRGNLIGSLNEAGFKAAQDNGRHPGKHAGNICNMGQARAGIQLEISLGARRSMFAGMSRSDRQNVRPPFYRFIEAVRYVLQSPYSALSC
jgi:phage replication-related protein YjqB (UPF0714/DUF867 family)